MSLTPFVETFRDSTPSKYPSLVEGNIGFLSLLPPLNAPRYKDAHKDERMLTHTDNTSQVVRCNYRKCDSSNEAVLPYLVNGISLAAQLAAWADLSGRSE